MTVVSCKGWRVGRGVSHRAFLRTMKVVENGIVNDESKTYLDQHDEPITPICLSDASRLNAEVSPRALAYLRALEP